MHAFTRSVSGMSTHSYLRRPLSVYSLSLTGGHAAREAGGLNTALFYASARLLV